MRCLRWLPLAAVAVAMLAVAAWTLSRPVEDVSASLAGFAMMSALALPMVGALHLAIE